MDFKAAQKFENQLRRSAQNQTCAVTSGLSVAGFAPRHLRRSALSLEMETQCCQMKNNATTSVKEKCLVKRGCSLTKKLLAEASN